MSDRQGNQTGEPEDPGFAPGDYTDGRKLGDWQSRYSEEARSSIRWEAAYLSLLLAAVVTSMFLVWLGYPQRLLGLTDNKAVSFTRHSLAAASGVFGGVIFAMKWLYHSVAKQLWNLDRRLWRYFAPLISGALAFSMILVTESFGVLDPNLASTNARTTALGFLVGLFSDNALAKLAEVAQTLFGPTHKRGERHNNR
jgi:H+/Cl- antiporter ClcA